MAQRLIAHCAALVLALGASSAGQAALAQTLADPMRPPYISTSERAAEAAPGEQEPSRLQSVLISPARRLAVIDGSVVPLGGRVGDATVVAISATEVVLKRGDERETLKLYPGVQIKAVPRLQPAKVTK
jgi:MSHA biogenesis protein MshK